MMLKFAFENLGGFDTSSITHKFARISKKVLPVFATYNPNFQRMFELAEKYQDKTHFIIIGRGGSTTSFKAIYYALAEYVTTKKVYFLETTDPDYAEYVKRQCPIERTLAIVISKSGNTVDVIENLFAFIAYEKLIITSEGENALRILSNNMECGYIEHPDVGGRFTAVTEVALTPAAIIYMPVERLFNGMRNMHAKCAPANSVDNNPALELAFKLYMLEHQRYLEVYVPIYSYQMTGSAELILQLMHESVGKEGVGQTYLPLAAPQSQHHSNQRFMGGRKNMVGLFVKVEKQYNNESIYIPEKFHSIKLRDGSVGLLDGLTLSESISFEYEGTMKDATRRKIPNATISLEQVTPESVGELIGFFQYLASYSAWLRNVDPFNQPDVEKSKEISFEERKKHQQSNKI